MKTKTIVTDDGSRIRIEDNVDNTTVAILKSAPFVRFREWHYTGNSLNGSNNANWEDLEAWLIHSGLTLVDVDDDFSMVCFELSGHGSGVHQLEHRGKRLRYHAQMRNPPPTGSNSFGYTTIMEYRLISCETV